MSLPTISTINNGESAGVIRQKLNENFASILSALGDRGLSWSGSYDNATQYQKGNVVYYGSALYIAKNDVIGLIPTNTSAWDFLLDGPQGIPGADGAGAGDMLKSDNLSGLADYAVARSNMGLGSLATQSGTFSDKEDVANKSTSVTTDQASNTKYPSVKSVYDWGIATFAKYLGDADFYKYSIVTSVASGNLTVALKNYEGNDPTPTKPVKIQIGDVVRSITSSFSFMLNAGTNWFNSGSAELATKEIDYFGYIRYSPGGLSLIISRCPNANIVSDFSASGTYTNEKYACDSNGTTYLTTDPVVNIGRFNATLSAGGAYTWSIPATSVIINNPTYDTRDLDITMSSTGAVVSSWDYAKYKIVGNTVYMEFRGDGKSITGSGPITHKLPFNMKNIGMGTTCQIYDGTQWLLPLTGGNEIFKTINAGNWSGTETGVSIRANKQYFI